MSAFRFVQDPARFRPQGFVARLPSGLSGKTRLMAALIEALELPAHFGGNWDALSDVLRDLSWLPKGPVTVIHQGLPDLPELHAYLSVLSAAIAEWTPGESHSLAVVFAAQDRARVASAE